MIVAPPDDSAYSEALTLLLARSDLRMSDIFDARATLKTQLGLLAVDLSTEEDVAALEDAWPRSPTRSSRRTAAASGSHVAFHAALLHALHLPALDETARADAAADRAQAAPPSKPMTCGTSTRTCQSSTRFARRTPTR